MLYPECQHAHRTEAGWVIPPSGGTLGVRRAHNGSTHVIWVCDTCGKECGPIPHSYVADVRSLAVLVDYAGLFGRCIVKGCEDDEVEWHHFGPVGIFGEDADRWPQGYLCRRHHQEWGERVTPALNPPRRSA